MNCETLVRKLRALINNDSDAETNHMAADAALLKYIDDPRVTAAFNKLYKWYS